MQGTRRDKDLAALDTLIRIYSRPTVDTWRAYGIITIPPEVIESFLTIGQLNGARWGGEYERSKDTCISSCCNSPTQSHKVAQRERAQQPVSGLEDLYSPRTQPTPVNGPP